MQCTVFQLGLWVFVRLTPSQTSMNKGFWTVYRRRKGGRVNCSTLASRCLKLTSMNIVCFIDSMCWDTNRNVKKLLVLPTHGKQGLLNISVRINKSWFVIDESDYNQIKIIKYSRQKLQNRGCLSFSIIMFLPYFTHILFEIRIEKNVRFMNVLGSELALLCTMSYNIA